VNLCVLVGQVVESDAKIVEQNSNSVHFTLMVPRYVSGKHYAYDRLPIQATGRTAGSEHIRGGSVVEVHGQIVQWLKNKENRCLIKADRIIPVPGPSE
jgi:hypothetical protein